MKKFLGDWWKHTAAGLKVMLALALANLIVQIVLLTLSLLLLQKI